MQIMKDSKRIGLTANEIKENETYVLIIKVGCSYKSRSQ